MVNEITKAKCGASISLALIFYAGCVIPISIIFLPQNKKIYSVLISFVVLAIIITMLFKCLSIVEDINAKKRNEEKAQTEISRTLVEENSQEQEAGV